MPNFFLRKALVLAVLVSVCSGAVYAAETETEVDKEASQVEAIKAKDEIWLKQLKEKYSLTDEQMKAMKDSGVSYPQMAMIAQLAKSSGKTTDDIIKMRTEQKMGWGKIAKELGVAPKEIGQSVRDMKHLVRDERQEDRKEQHQLARAERKENAEMRREERKERHAKKEH